MSHDFVPSRRQLIAGGAVAAAILPGISITAASAKPFAMQDLEGWEAQTGKEFTVNGTPMRLIAVKGATRQPSKFVRKHNFTTVFEMQGNVVPDAGIHTVAHAELGQAALYLEPSVSKDGKPRLRASFS